jgi:arginyl-tRNA--protein-N-Asp/Glu arginylyltransferase
MQIQLFRVENGKCPYLPNRKWVTQSFRVASLPASLYEEMLAYGWRRSGMSFYQNTCPGCNCCTQTRVPVRRFTPSQSQRRVLRRNSDVRIEIRKPAADETSVNLYRRYLEARHAREGEEPDTQEQFTRFLVDSPVDTKAVHYYSGDRPIGVGWIDVLENGLSSVYFAFEPDQSRRSLGTFSFMKEMELAAELGLEWLYVGFYVPGSPKMAYKASLRPREFAVNGAWTKDETLIDCPDFNPATAADS